MSEPTPHELAEQVLPCDCPMGQPHARWCPSPYRPALAAMGAALVASDGEIRKTVDQ